MHARRLHLTSFLSVHPGVSYPFKFQFEDYLPMPEYHNILVKMFALDRFP